MHMVIYQLQVTYLCKPIGEMAEVRECAATHMTACEILTVPREIHLEDTEVAVLDVNFLI